MNPLVRRIEALGLLRTERLGEVCAVPERLEALCDEGLLVGGLSVNLDVRPDELLGPLVQQVGGAAAALKISEVRDTDAGVELQVCWAKHDETWTARDARELVEALNRAFAFDGAARVTAVLGEWNDALQLWCLPRKSLVALRQEPRFRPENGEGWW